MMGKLIKQGIIGVLLVAWAFQANLALAEWTHTVEGGKKGITISTNIPKVKLIRLKGPNGLLLEQKVASFQHKNGLPDGQYNFSVHAEREVDLTRMQQTQTLNSGRGERVQRRKTGVSEIYNGYFIIRGGKVLKEEALREPKPTAEAVKN